MWEIARREVWELLNKSQETTTEPISETNIMKLPEPVQRYLRYSGVIGQEKIKTVRLKQKGFFRPGENLPWMPMIAEQYYTTNPPAFLWFGTVKALPFLSISARDKFIDGQGSMLVKLQSFFTLTNARGDKIDRGALLRYLGEMMWFPTAWLSDYIQWQEIDCHSVRAILNCNGLEVSAVLHFNADGQIVKLTAQRYREVKGEYALDEWEAIPMTNYQEFNGLRIPVNVEVLWKLEYGNFSYFRGEVVDIDYNNVGLY